GNARVAAGRIDREIGGVAKLGDARPILSPLAQTVLPQLRLLLRELVGTDALLAGILLIDPWAEVFGAKFRKRKEKVSQIALGIDDDRRDAVDRRLFQQRDAQPGLSAAGHA